VNRLKIFSLGDANRMRSRQNRILLYAINVDWYFLLHWTDRAKAAQREGYHVHVATYITSAENKQKILAMGFILHQISFFRHSINPVKNLAAIKSLYGIIKRINPALIHCVTLKPVAFGGMIARLCKIPCVASIVGLGYLFSNQSLKSQTIWFLLKRFLWVALNAKTTKMTFENHHDFEQLTSKGMRKKKRGIIISGAGVDLSRFHPTPEESTDIVKVLFAARLLHSKGLDLLRQCVLDLKREGIFLQLNVAGIVDAESRDAMELELLEHWNHEGSVVWHGTVDDIERLISESHIVCLPTTYGEGVPRILIEAAASGRPVIATNVPGCNNFVIDGIDGIIVSPANHDALTVALRNLAKSKRTREKFGINGRNKVKNIYSNKTVIFKTLCLYRSLLLFAPTARRRKPLSSMMNPHRPARMIISSIPIIRLKSPFKKSN